MALSGSVTTGEYDGRSVTLEWSASQNAVDNNSVVSWRLVGSGGSPEWITVNELKAVIDGVQVYYKSSSDAHTECYNGTILATGSCLINHNSDGGKSFNASVEAGIYQWRINRSGNGYFTLDTINRESSISVVENVEIGNKCRIKWTPSSSTFSYKLKFVLGQWNYMSDVISPNTTNEFEYNSYTIPLDVANQITNSTSSIMTVYLYTYSNSSCSMQVGSVSSRNFMVTVPSSMIPVINEVRTYVDNSANSVVSSWGVAVVGYTKVKIESKATGSYGSIINGYSISNECDINANNSQLSYISKDITSSGDKIFSIIAEDSRGRKSLPEDTLPITFYPYSKPEISYFIAQRLPTDMKKVVVKANWSFSSVNNKNSVTAILQFKQVNSASWISYGEISKNEVVLLMNDFEEINSYNFRLVVEDGLENISQADTLISTISVLVDFKSGGRGISFGKISENDGFECAMDAKFNKNVMLNNGIEINGDLTLNGDKIEQLHGEETIFSYTTLSSGQKATVVNDKKFSFFIVYSSVSARYFSVIVTKSMLGEKMSVSMDGTYYEFILSLSDNTYTLERTQSLNEQVKYIVKGVW